MMGGVFISYRRRDSEDFAGRLFDHLQRAFGDAEIFFDVETIDPGTDFQAEIDRRLKRCSAFILIIGPRWLDAWRSKDGTDDPEAPAKRDHHLYEIEGALRDGLRIVPVFFGGVGSLNEADLPPKLAALATLHRILVRTEFFARDIAPIIETVEKLTGSRRRSADASPSAPPADPLTRPLRLVVAGAEPDPSPRPFSFGLVSDAPIFDAAPTTIALTPSDDPFSRLGLRSMLGGPTAATAARKADRAAERPRPSATLVKTVAAFEEIMHERLQDRRGRYRRGRLGGVSSALSVRLRRMGVPVPDDGEMSEGESLVLWLLGHAHNIARNRPATFLAARFNDEDDGEAEDAAASWLIESRVKSRGAVAVGAALRCAKCSSSPLAPGAPATPVSPASAFDSLAI